MNIKINKEDEFYEVLNTFPFLKDIFKKYEINPDNIKEGISVENFLKNEKKYSNDEIDIFLKKINFDIRYFFKHNNLPKTKKLIKEEKALEIELI